jgi:hypothetical protein
MSQWKPRREQSRGLFQHRHKGWLKRNEANDDHRNG